MADKLAVKAGPRVAPGQVALWEVHPDHPDGEVFVAAPHPGEKETATRVAGTPEVLLRLGDGRLVEAGKQAAKSEE